MRLIVSPETFYKGSLDTHDRARLEGLVRHAVARFEAEDDEGRREEFRQLLKSYLRFYTFVAQIIRLGDTGLEKLCAYAAWLSRLLPNREMPADIEITEDMLRLQAFRVEQKEQGTASLDPGDTKALTPISEFAARPYTEEEERSLSEIIKAFNDRHGTAFTRDDFIRFEQVNREILNDDLTEMLRNNPPDVVFSAFSEAFFKGAIKMFQRDKRNEEHRPERCTSSQSSDPAFLQQSTTGGQRTATRMTSGTAMSSNKLLICVWGADLAVAGILSKPIVVAHIGDTFECGEWRPARTSRPPRIAERQMIGRSADIVSPIPKPRGRHC